MDPNDCLFLLNVLNRSTGKPTRGFILMDRMDPNGNLAAAAITAWLLLGLIQPFFRTVFFAVASTLQKPVS